MHILGTFHSLSRPVPGTLVAVTDAHRGRLLGPSDAPARGERAGPVARIGNVVIEQVVSGLLAAPVAYDQDHDEWALVRSGAAILEVRGERMHLTACEWVLLPARTPHRLVETRPGTTWLTVRSPPEGPPQ